MLDTSNLIDNILLKRVGSKIIFFIRRRTNKGTFLPGSSDNAGSYSSKPFALPFGALNATTGKKIKEIDSRFSGDGDYKLFTSNNKNLWVVAQRGYKGIRKEAGKYNDHVIMSWSGQYLRDLGIIATGSKSVDVGWKNARNRELASYHEKLGAGKSKRKHKIMGLLKSEEKEIRAFIEEELVKNLKKNWK